MVKGMSRYKYKSVIDTLDKCCMYLDNLSIRLCTITAIVMQKYCSAYLAQQIFLKSKDEDTTKSFAFYVAIIVR
jgi:hypothetical protein